MLQKVGYGLKKAKKSAVKPQSCRFSCLKEKEIFFSVKLAFAANASNFLQYTHTRQKASFFHRKSWVALKYAAFAASH
jgi:hypothetical protein